MAVSVDEIFTVRGKVVRVRIENKAAGHWFQFEEGGILKRHYVKNFGINYASKEFDTLEYFIRKSINGIQAGGERKVLRVSKNKYDGFYDININNVTTGTLGDHIVKQFIDEGLKQILDVSVFNNEGEFFQPVTFDLNITPPSSGASDGQIEIIPVDGTAPFDYSIDNGQTIVQNPVFTGLSAGTYKVKVRDDFNIIASETIII